MAGFVYPVTTIPSLHSGWTKLNPLPGIFNAEASLASITVPLAFEPGTSRAYGVGITWAGKLVERVSSLRLDEYFRQHIFDHVEGGMPDVSFFPTPEIKKRKMWMCSRDGEGKIKATGRFGLGRAEEAEKISTELLLGGEGLFGTLKDYLAFLRAVLQCDPRYRSNIPHPLLSAGSYAELFRGSIPPLSAKHDGRSNLVQQVGAAGYLDPPPTPETLDHSVGFCLTLVDCVEARKKGSGFWSGVAKTQYWIDPTTGIAVSPNCFLKRGGGGIDCFVVTRRSAGLN